LYKIDTYQNVKDETKIGRSEVNTVFFKTWTLFY